MYDNPDVVPEYPNGGEQPQSGLCSKLNTNDLYDSVKSISNQILNSIFIKDAEERKREIIDRVHKNAWKSIGDKLVALMLRDRHPDTGEELDLIN